MRAVHEIQHELAVARVRDDDEPWSQRTRRPDQCALQAPLRGDEVVVREFFAQHLSMPAMEPSADFNPLYPAERRVFVAVFCTKRDVAPEKKQLGVEGVGGSLRPEERRRRVLRSRCQSEDDARRPARIEITTHF